MAGGLATPDEVEQRRAHEGAYRLRPVRTVAEPVSDGAEDRDVRAVLRTEPILEIAAQRGGQAGARAAGPDRDLELAAIDHRSGEEVARVRHVDDVQQHVLCARLVAQRRDRPRIDDRGVGQGRPTEVPATIGAGHVPQPAVGRRRRQPGRELGGDHGDGRACFAQRNGLGLGRGIASDDHAGPALEAQEDRMGAHPVSNRTRVGIPPKRGRGVRRCGGSRVPARRGRDPCAPTLLVVRSRATETP